MGLIMKCKKCGSNKITKYYKSYCRDCSEKEREIVEIVIKNKVKEAIEKNESYSCQSCGGPMDRLQGDYGLFFKCQKKTCGCTKNQYGKSTASKPDKEIQQVIENLAARKKLNTQRKNNSVG